MTTLTATALARNFSAYLNQVCYQGASFEIQRGAEVVARLTPPAPVGGYPLERLAALLVNLPPLDDDEADAFRRDIDAANAQLTAGSEAWDS